VSLPFRGMTALPVAATLRLMRRLLLPLLLLALTVPGAAVAGDYGLRDLRGTISSLDGGAIVVTRDDRKLTCATGSSPQTAALEVGDRVLLLCRRTTDGNLLVFVKKLDVNRLASLGGRVTSTGGQKLALRNAEKGKTLVCTVPARLAGRVGRLAVGDRVFAICRVGDDGSELLRFERFESPTKPDNPAVSGEGATTGGETVDIAGRVSALGVDGVSITNGDSGRTLRCRVPDGMSAKLAELKVGDLAKMVCRGGVVSVLARVAPVTTPPATEPPHPAPGTTVFTFTGPVAGLSADRVGVSVDGGEKRSCFVPVELRPQLAGFALGTLARLSCVGADLAHASLTAIEHVETQ
jgi:hypothetical protein